MTNKKVENLRTAWEGLASENVKFYIRTTSKAEMHSKGHLGWPGIGHARDWDPDPIDR